MSMKKTEYLHASIEDHIAKALRQNIPVYTKFFNQAEQCYIEKLFVGADDVKYVKDGGYEEAERCIFTIYSAFIDYNMFHYIPIKALKLEWNGLYSKVEHRDILGAILGLGIKREIIGDIIVDDHMAYVFVVEDMAHYIAQNLQRVGTASVTVECFDIEEIDVIVPKPKSIVSVVPSLRLDCIVSAGFGMSRNKSLSMVKAGRVMLNWEVCTKPAQEVEPGDIITIRGKGRIRFRNTIRMTKKNRLSIEIERYM